MNSCLWEASRCIKWGQCGTLRSVDCFFRYGDGSTTGFPDLTGVVTAIDGSVFTALIASGYAKLAKNK